MAAIKEYQAAWQMLLIRLAYLVNFGFGMCPSTFLTNHPPDIGRGGCICRGSLTSREFSGSFQFTLLGPTARYPGHLHMVSLQVNTFH